MQLILLSLLLLLFPSIANATVLYVRTDGGNGTQCTGQTDHALAGASGTNCALNHPNWVYPPRGESSSRAASSGDLVVIESGSYRIGCQNSSNCRDANVNLTNSGFCSAGAPYDCYMGVVPSGTDLYGCTTNGCSSQSAVPELWGAGRVTSVLSLYGSSSITLRDLNITDHAACGWATDHDCGSADPLELSGYDGILLTHTTNIFLTNVKVHGLYHSGIRAGYAQNLTFNGDTLGASAVDFNPESGINFDECNNDHTCGVTNGNFIKFLGNNPNQMMSISWNGCVEDPNNIGSPIATGCSSTYGDGFGTTATSGNWTINYLRMVHNTSDGLDLRYCYNTGCVVDVRNSHFGGNAGNQFKAAGNLLAYNNLIEADCDFFEGKSFKGSNMQACRAAGDAMFFGFQDSSVTKKFYGNTVINEKGNVLWDACSYATSCTSSNTIDFRNNIFTSPGRWSGIGGGPPGYFYAPTTGSDPQCGGCSAVTVTQTNNIINGFSSNPSGSGNTYADPQLSGTFDGSTASCKLSSTSPARDSGSTTTGQPSTDFNAFNRGASYDKGFLEFNSTFSGGSPFCGDGTIVAPEVCDSANLNGQDCTKQGFTSGTLACNAQCTGFDTSGCVTSLCGNGNIDTGEQCDGSNIGTATCSSLGFSGTGTPGCSACALTQGTCQNSTPSMCGDGIVQVGEECDPSPGNTINGDGCSDICENEIPPYQLFRTYTDGDSATYIDTHTNYAQVAGMTRTADAYLQKDFGASFFTGDFTHDFTVKIDSCSDDGAGHGGILGAWGMSMSPRTSIKDMTNNTDGAAFYMYCLSSASQFKWSMIVNGSATTVEYDDPTPVNTRYVRISRVSGVLTAKIYSDINHTSLLATLTPATDTHAYRYFYAPISYNTANSNTLASGRVSNYNLSAGSQITPPVATVGTKFTGCTCTGCKIQ